MGKKKKLLTDKASEAIVTHGILSNLDKILEVGAFGGLVYTYMVLEDGNAKVALPQACIDFMLLKSRTEVGVGSAVAHVGIRALMEWSPGSLVIPKTVFIDKMKIGTVSTWNLFR